MPTERVQSVIIENTDNPRKVMVDLRSDDGHTTICFFTHMNMVQDFMGGKSVMKLTAIESPEEPKFHAIR